MKNLPNDLDKLSSMLHAGNLELLRAQIHVKQCRSAVRKIIAKIAELLEAKEEERQFPSNKVGKP